MVYGGVELIYENGGKDIALLTYFDNHVEWLFMLLTVIER